MEDGVVNGDIYLVGGGDPLLLTPSSSPRWPRREPAPHSIENLAEDLVDHGLALVTGAVVGDASRYDNLLYVGSWPESMIESETIGTLLALQFDDGWVQFPVPESARDDDEAPSEEEVGYLAAENPPFYAAALFDDMLEARDVVIRRSPRSEAVPREEEVYMLASIASAPLSDYYQQILDNRDIETTELLLKKSAGSRRAPEAPEPGRGQSRRYWRGSGSMTKTSNCSSSMALGRIPANVATCPVFTRLLGSEEFRPFFQELLPLPPIRARFKAGLPASTTGANQGAVGRVGEYRRHDGLHRHRPWPGNDVRLHRQPAGRGGQPSSPGAGGAPGRPLGHPGSQAES